MADSAAPIAPAPRRGLLVAVLAIGVGLVMAPVVFQMFTRAPKGGRMIEEFRPYMTTAEIDKFRDYLAEIGRADAEARATLPPVLSARLGLTPAEARQRFPAVADFEARWPTIDADMNDMLATMRRDIGRFEGVDSLPPFVLFPWFFVIPGLLIAGLAGRSLVVSRRGRPARRQLIALGVVGVGLLAAPAMFQMFSRAPGGGRMIEDFEPLMTTEKVTTVQGYFLTIGAAEGQLRTEVLPALNPAPAPAGSSPSLPDLPAISAFHENWPRISNEMAPMIGTMADNVDNFAAVVALPPFGLFPWFFVVPGLLVIGLTVGARRRPAGRRPRPTGEETDLPFAPAQELAQRSTT